MFERPHHRRIAQVLEALDAPALEACGCLFGGGTAIVLRQGEYRESVDIDFVVSRVDGYRSLRQRPDRLEACMRALGMTGVSRAALWERIRALVH